MQAKYHSLKRAYIKSLRKIVRKLAIMFEGEMQFLLQYDPAFKPLVMKSLLGSHEVNNNRADTEDEVEEEEDDSS